MRPIPLLALLATGCATSMTHMTTPHALEPGDWQVTGAWTGQVASVPATKSIQAGADLWDHYVGEDDPPPLSEDEVRTLLDTGLAWGLFHPGTSYELAVRLGVTDKLARGLDIGLRTDFAAVKGDLKLQLWESEGGMFAVGAYAGYGYGFSLVGGAVEWLTLTDFSRHDLDVGATWGLEAGKVLRLWTGPRYLHSWIRAEPKLAPVIQEHLPEAFQSYEPNQFMGSSSAHYFGWIDGVMVGWRYVFLVAELNLAWMAYHPEILEERRNFSGLVIAPDVGVTATW
ncbi:MAG: hypothetical protein ABIO70_30535 [Pseudomonadota bacterium]